ncbi:glycosyltransferase [Nocardioides sp.]|uniref:glycosyltransferase n=1 Tax=Nocardioides sp. TaxID=35761 RepID=UPI00378440AD
MTAPRALVVTVVHHPEDARIRHRQVAALLDAGWRVTYAAPFHAYAVTPTPCPGLTHVDLPRARGRHRLRALAGARSVLRRDAAGHDVVLLHDPELLLAARGLRLPPVVWDVHEDTAASTTLKPWLPGPARGPVARMVGRFERGAEDRVHLLLAEEEYRSRFRRPHPVVPNTTTVPASVPPPDEPRVVYVGHLSRARGVEEMVELGRLLHDRTAGRLRVQLVGAADTAAAAALADAPPGVEWLGFRPHNEAMRVLDGALAGLSLLHDEPNYRVSQPTKVVEYLAHGVPAVTTALPRAATLVDGVGAGVVVPFRDGRADPGEVADLVVALDRNPAVRGRMAARGRAHAAAHLDWRRQAPAFVGRLAAVAGLGPVAPAGPPPALSGSGSWSARTVRG